VLLQNGRALVDQVLSGGWTSNKWKKKQSHRSNLRYCGCLPRPGQWLRQTVSGFCCGAPLSSPQCVRRAGHILAQTSRLNSKDCACSPADTGRDPVGFVSDGLQRPPPSAPCRPSVASISARRLFWIRIDATHQFAAAAGSNPGRRRLPRCQMETSSASRAPLGKRGVGQAYGAWLAGRLATAAAAAGEPSRLALPASPTALQHGDGVQLKGVSSEKTVSRARG